MTEEVGTALEPRVYDPEPRGGHVSLRQKGEEGTAPNMSVSLGPGLPSSV
jgi:hypothetical protein